MSYCLTWKTENGVWIAVDSIVGGGGARDTSKTLGENSRKLIQGKGWVAGVIGNLESIAALNLLTRGEEPTVYDGEADPYEWLLDTFCVRLREIYVARGFLRKDQDGADRIGNAAMLIVVGGEVFEVGPALYPIEHAEKINGIGGVGPEAQVALAMADVYTTKPTRGAMVRVLKILAQYTAYCRAPYHVLFVPKKSVAKPSPNGRTKTIYKNSHTGKLVNKDHPFAEAHEVPTKRNYTVVTTE